MLNWAFDSQDNPPHTVTQLAGGREISADMFTNMHEEFALGVFFNVSQLVLVWVTLVKNFHVWMEGL